MRVDDGIVLYIPSRQSFADLDEAAAAVFEALAESDWTTRRAVEMLCRRHDVDAAEAREALDSTTFQLEALGAVESA